MNTSQLEYIIAIAEEKNLTKAADRLYITQSALSQQLARLRKEGLPPLFEKHGRIMELTDAGRIYVNGARSILTIEEDARLALKNLSSSQVRLLNIAMSASITSLFLTRAMSELTKRLPAISVRLRPVRAGHAVEMLEQGAADLALFPTISQHREFFHYTDLWEDELVIAALTGREERLLPWVVPEHDSHLYHVCERVFSVNQIQPQIFAETNDMSAAVRAALTGECAVVLPRSCVREPRLSCTSFREPGIFRVVAVRKKKSDQQEAEEAVIKELLRMRLNEPERDERLG